MLTGVGFARSSACWDDYVTVRGAVLGVDGRVISLCDIDLQQNGYFVSVLFLYSDFSDNMAYEKILNKGPTPHYYIKLVV